MNSFITTVTQKGQVTLPAEFRRQLGILPFSKVKVTLTSTKNGIKIKPTQDILDLAGTIKPRKNKQKTALDARQTFERDYHRV